MKVKVCFNNEIHVISKVPDTLSGFVGLLKSTFQSKLPNDWALQYTDSDGDNILMNDEKDYEEFTNPDPATSTKVPKIYVISIESFRPVDEPVKVESDDVVPNNEEDDYQVIQKEEPVVTEVPKEEENPVVPEVAEVEQDVQNKWDIKEDERQVEETKEEKVARPEVNESKVLVDLNELANMISRLIDSKLPQMVESIKNQDSSRDISLCENIVAYPGANILAEEPPKAQKAVSQVKHFGVSCSGCQMMPIVGIRYRCSVCPRFDYCERCEETCEHVHDMVKMKQRDLLDIFRPQPRPVVPEVVIPADLMEEKVEEKERKSKQEKKEEKRVRKTYYSDLKRKAKKLQKCFPKEDFDILCAYVNGAPEDMTLEELVENFKH